MLVLAISQVPGDDLVFDFLADKSQVFIQRLCFPFFADDHLTYLSPKYFFYNIESVLEFVFNVASHLYSNDDIKELLYFNCKLLLFSFHL